MANGNVRDIDVYLNESFVEKEEGEKVVTSVNGMVGDVVIDKKALGIENVDNTRDLDKPISNAVQSALNAKANSGDVSTINNKINAMQDDLTEVENDLASFKETSTQALEDVQQSITTEVSEAITGAQVDITQLYNSLQGYIGTKNILNYASIVEDADYGALCSVSKDGEVTIANTLLTPVTPYTTKQYLNAETYTFSITSDTAGLTYFVGRGDTVLAQEQTVKGTKTFTFTNQARVKIKVGVMVPASTTAKVFLQIEKGEEATSFVKSVLSANDYLDRVRFGENTALGSGALDRLTTGENNTAVGENALATLGTSTDNTAVGSNTLKAVTGVNNTAVGSNTALRTTTGENNTAVGGYSLMMNTTGKNNTAVGTYANTTTQAFSNTTAIGANSAVTGDNQVQLGDSNTSVYTFGAVQNRSDQRDKTDIADTDLGLGFIRKLRPRKYRHDFRCSYDELVEITDDCGCLVGYEKVEHEPDGSKAGTRFHYGLIAQEVKETLDELGVDWAGYQDHSINGGADIKTIGYTECISPMLKAIQEIDNQNTVNYTAIKEALLLLASNSYIKDDSDGKTYKIGSKDGKLYVTESETTLDELVDSITDVIAKTAVISE